METLNNYPMILVHGFSGWGDQELAGKLCPYFGMYKTSVEKFYEHLGVECYTPSIGPFSSCWDRACELYAQLKGGRVDYGKVHSEKNGHKRYGKRFKAMVPDWGQLSKDGKIKKVNLIGHSMGAPTVRVLVDLLVNGNAEEREGTPEKELSDLFKGGKEKWVHSVTTLVGANGGISSLYAIEKVREPIAKAVLYLFSFLGNTPISKFYDTGLAQFGINDEPSWFNFSGDIRTKEIEKYLNSDDCVLNDLIVHTALERMKDFKPYDSIYYFAYAGCTTKPGLGGKHHGTLKMLLPLRPVAYILGHYTHKKADANHAAIGPQYFPNDGMVNVVSARAPQDEPQTDFESNSACKPGIWYNMPVEYNYHQSYMGMGEPRDVYWKFFYDILDRVNNLESID